MVRVNPELLGLRCPLFADKFLGRQTLEGLKPATKVVGIDKVSEVLPQLHMIVIAEALDRGFLDGPVHPLDLPIGPRMFDLGQAVFDAILLADPTEDMLERVPVTATIGELDAVVGKYRV